MISVIIPCYNAEPYIRECLDSLFCQTFTDLQIICVDDGSTDKTAQILKAFSAMDPQLQVIFQKNSGISAARNAGLKIATGDYIAFVDADDWLEPNTFEKVLRGHREDVVFFSYYRNFKEGQIIKDLAVDGVYEADYIQRRIIGLVGSELKNIASFDALMTCWGKLYKRSVIGDVRFRDLKDFGTWEDGVFNVEVLEKAKEIRIINQPFYHYRKIPRATFTTNYKADLPEKWKYKFNWLADFLNRHAKPQIYHQALTNRIAVTTLNLAFNEMNSASVFRKRQDKINQILSDEIFSRALANLSIKQMSPLWRIFYYFAKKQNAFAVTIMTDLIYRYINRKNN